MIGSGRHRRQGHTDQICSQEPHWGDDKDHSPDEVGSSGCGEGTYEHKRWHYQREDR